MRIKRIQAPIIVGLLLLMLISPQLTLADPGYSISLFPSSGHCGDLCEATVTFTDPGTYRICWKSPTPENVIRTFTTDTPGNRTIEFRVPSEITKGIYYVYLTREDYRALANATFEVLPSVQIDPTKGPVGTVVTISGCGFNATQDIRVSFFQGEVKKGEAKTGKSDAKGSWSINYTIPETPGGGYVFKVEFKEGVVWYDLVGKYFKVTPKITATPNRGTVGQTIEIKGTGFGEDEKNIQVTFDGDVRAAGIVANKEGTWIRTITIPPRQAGTYDIDASGTLTRARDVENIKFVLEPGIQLEPNPAYVGQTIVVSGGGFRPGETNIKVTFGGQVRATVPAADTNGCWETFFVLPPSPYGANTVSARGDITAVTNNLTVNARIEVISPSEGAPGTYVSLTGSGFSSSKRLRVTIGAFNVTGNWSTKSDGDVAITFRVPKGVPRGKQVLKVTDDGGAMDEKFFTVIDRSLSPPLPVSPHESTVRSGMVTFTWQGMSGDSDFTYTYTLEISKTPGGSPFRSKPNITGLSYTLTKEDALPKGTYYWRVKVVDNYGNESAWSGSIKFTVSPIPTWVWVVVGVVVLIGLMVVAYRETKFKVAE